MSKLRPRGKSCFVNTERGELACVGGDARILMDGNMNAETKGNIGVKKWECFAVGDKEINLFEAADETWTAMCECRALGATVQFSLTTEQVKEILSDKRRNIDDVLPDTPPALREIFITGTTPAEFDLNVIGKLRPKHAYKKLGYVFEPLVVCISKEAYGIDIGPFLFELK